MRVCLHLTALHLTAPLPAMKKKTTAAAATITKHLSLSVRYPFSPIINRYIYIFNVTRHQLASLQLFDRNSFNFCVFFFTSGATPFSFVHFPEYPFFDHISFRKMIPINNKKKKERKSQIHTYLHIEQKRKKKQEKENNLNIYIIYICTYIYTILARARLVASKDIPSDSIILYTDLSLYILFNKYIYNNLFKLNVGLSTIKYKH